MEDCEFVFREKARLNTFEAIKLMKYGNCHFNNYMLLIVL